MKQPDVFFPAASCKKDSMTNKYVFGPSYFVTALATKKVQTCRKVDKSLTMGQESTYLIVLLEIAISELKNQYALIKNQILRSLSFTDFGSRLMHTTALHCTLETLLLWGPLKV